MLPGQQLDQINEVQQPTDGSGDSSLAMFDEVMQDLLHDGNDAIAGGKSAFDRPSDGRMSDQVQEDDDKFLEITPIAALMSDQKNELSEEQRREIDENFFGNRANGNPNELVISLDAYTRKQVGIAA